MKSGRAPTSARRMALPTFARLEILRATGTPTDAYQGETWPQALWFRQRVRAGHIRSPVSPRGWPGTAAFGQLEHRSEWQGGAIWPVLDVLLARARSVKRTSLFNLSRGRDNQAGRGVDKPGLRRPPRRPPGGRESGDRLLVVEVDLLDPVGVEQRRCRRTISQRNCTGRASKPDRSTAHVWLCKPMTGLRQIWTRALGPLGSQEG